MKRSSDAFDPSRDSASSPKILARYRPSLDLGLDLLVLALLALIWLALR